MNLIATQSTTTTDPITSATSATSSSNAVNPADPNSELTSENTFLKLLVAQIKNQDPLNPTDPTQFVGQLTQYSELEQLIQINSGIQTLDPGASSSISGAASSTGNASTEPVTTTSHF